MRIIIFLCHGNICRSSAAEYVFKDLLKKEGREKDFCVLSRGASSEEQGNDIYPPMKRALRVAGIPFERHTATKITQEDYDHADAIFYMDESNIKFMAYNRINDTRKICHPLSIFTPRLGEIEDPWYTGEFDEVLSEIAECCKDILKNIDRIV